MQDKPIYGFTTSHGSLYVIDRKGMTSRFKVSSGRGQGGWGEACHCLFTRGQLEPMDLYSSGNSKGYLGYRQPGTDRFIQFSGDGSDRWSTAGMPADVQPVIRIDALASGRQQFYPAVALPELGLTPVEVLHYRDAKNGDWMGVRHMGHPVDRVFFDRHSLIEQGARLGLDRAELAAHGAVLDGAPLKPRQQTRVTTGTATPFSDMAQPAPAAGNAAGTSGATAGGIDSAAFGADMASTFNGAAGMLPFHRHVWAYSPGDRLDPGPRIQASMPHDQSAAVLRALQHMSIPARAAVRGSDWSVQVGIADSLAKIPPPQKYSTGQDADGRMGVFERVYHAYRQLDDARLGRRYDRLLSPTPTEALNRGFERHDDAGWHFVPGSAGGPGLLRLSVPAEAARPTETALNGRGIRARYAGGPTLREAGGVQVARHYIDIPAEPASLGPLNDLALRAGKAARDATRTTPKQPAQHTGASAGRSTSPAPARQAAP